MSFLSPQTVSSAISRLHRDVHPFIGITFLACKRAGLPVGKQAHVSVDDFTRAHLDEYHFFPDLSHYYFQPFKSVKFWVDPKYPSTGLQAINTQTFSEVFNHQKGSPWWGFTSNYVVALSSKLRALRFRKKPRLIDLAIWIAKDTELGNNPSWRDLVGDFTTLFSISDEEIEAIFDDSEPSPEELSFVLTQPQPIEYLKFFDPAPDSPADIGGTLIELGLNHVGPVDHIDLELGDRITLLTGDNGLGKSFLLECAWWAATGDWAHDPAYPGEDRAIGGYEPSIEYKIKDHLGVSRSVTAPYNWRGDNWSAPSDRQRLLALGVFSAADGSFAVYDPSQPRGRGRRRHSITLTQSEIWGHGSKDIEGIVRDWKRWEQLPDRFPFELFSRMIAELSPEDLGVLKPGKSVRVPDDRRDVPTIEHPYGSTPIVFESAGVKRVLALAYLITWSIYEHRLAAARRNEAPLDRMIIVIDELESHLHPKWQRTILPALLSSLGEVAKVASSQIVVATHSPLVLSSIETIYDRSADRSYHFVLDGEKVGLEELEYTKQGDVSQWLTSPFIGLSYARSKAAEAAVAEAVSIQEDDNPDPVQVRRIDTKLRTVLSSRDKFWPRWTYFARRFGVDDDQG